MRKTGSATACRVGPWWRAGFMATAPSTAPAPMMARAIITAGPDITTAGLFNLDGLAVPARAGGREAPWPKEKRDPDFQSHGQASVPDLKAFKSLPGRNEPDRANPTRQLAASKLAGIAPRSFVHG